ncbi:MAG: 16S rRNA (guanine(527)-N(7))-methyltransferase RsmG [Lachnospiraceae bacterium]|nr:16S rRNA (guanine(527)-N(7))-methyltransferase RsmG [Lachnospiraceae bacterium]
MNVITATGFDREALRGKASLIGIELSDNMCAKFADYYRLLISWNEKMNLTSITDPDEVINKHFIDSLALVKSSSFRGDLSMIDVGTGAGFPGIPLKIVFPALRITLADSLRKRISFLEEAIKVLGLNGADAVHSRAEDLGRSKEYREKYDCAVSRAVARLNVLAEYNLPLVKPGGCFFAMKGADVQDELSESVAATVRLGASKDPELAVYSLPGTDYGRSIVTFKKIKNTPAFYPRKAGVPSKKPLV